MRVTIKTRRDTEANWTLINPKLALGEMGIETDTKKIKFGDGNSLWNDLQYISAGSGGEVVAEDIDDRISELLVAGSGISLSYSDEGDSLTISASGGGGSGISNIVEDTTPQLGGNLDANTFDINMGTNSITDIKVGQWDSAYGWGDHSTFGYVTAAYDAAVPWTPNHTLVDGTRYLAGDLVYENGRIYSANFDNESLPVSNETYWTDIGPGYRLNIDGRDIPNIPYPVDSVNGQTGDVELSTTDLDDFNTAVSGLLPVLNIVNGNGISVSSISGEFTISATGDFIIPVADIDLHNGGIQSAQVLQFNDTSKQSVITGPTPAEDSNAQRLIIQGQRASGAYAEGGDVYLWGGDADYNGGDIKIYAGDADNVSPDSGYGGYVNIDGGKGATEGGDVEITAGYSEVGQAGNVNIIGGPTATGIAGNVTIRTNNNNNTWTFDRDGTLIVPSVVQNYNSFEIKAGNATNTVEFVGQIDNGFGDGPGATLHVTSIINGTITDGMTIYGDGLPAEGWVLQFGTVMAPQGNGATGNYYLPGANYLIGSQSFNNGDATNNIWTFGTNGNLNIPGNIILPNYTTVATGTYDNGYGGNGGISLNCIVGYELNWQAGHLKSTYNNGEYTANIYCDSPIEFQGSGVDNMEINSSGLIFPDGTTQNSANIASTNITDFNSAVSGLLPVKNIIAGDNININVVDGAFTVSVTGIGGGGGGPTLEEIQDNLGNTFLVASTGISLNYSDSEGLLTIATSGVSLDGHAHIASDITDFNSSVSGLLPVKDIVSGTGISVSSVSGVFTIDSSLTSVSEASKLVTTVFNKTGSVIPKMSVVYISGGQGDLPTITLAIANGESGSSKTYGITAEAISDMSSGKVIVEGALTGLNTDQFNPTSPTGNVNGVAVYLSPTVAGGITTTKPSSPNHMVSVGTIVRTHQNEGVIEVRIQNGFELQELHNVAVSGVTSGQFLQYNGSSQWVPSSSGNFTHLSVNSTGVSLNGHTHTSSNITDFNSSVSGLLPVKNILGSTYISVVESSGAFTVSASGLQPSGNYSVSGHTHTSSQITDFNSSVSGLLPSNIIVSNVAGITGATTINNIVAISQANYDSLGTYDPNTIYYIV